MLARPLGFARRFAPRPLDKVVPPVRPADVEVHQDPGHRELRERIHVCKRKRPVDFRVQDGRERRQNRQPEVEDKKEDGRGYDESSLSSNQILERLRPFYAHPLVLSLHRAPFPRSSGRFVHYIATFIYGQAHTAGRMRTVAAFDSEKPPLQERGLSSSRSIHTVCSIFTAQALSSAVPDCGSTALMVRTLVGT